ncbi:nuclear pore complex protein Nup153 [Diachasma alloeum]|uniref:nuclear pore complex protein Nup153 n=1 Tax=Diachasma alloeum TaxID=454923 RepID=UPI0007381252|nr:nuclear pore complex protein Nup153 [Diachasma alloeum]
MAKRSYNNSAGRRAHGGKPYDPNNSFVKKMATKMTDFIPQRLWISKWFNSPTSNGDLSNEDTESPDDVGETMLQPPAKRPRIRMDVTHPPGTFAIQPRARNLKDQYHRDETVDFLDSETAGPSGSRSFVSSTPAFSMKMMNSNLLQSDLIRQQQNNGTANGIDENSESGESTSGCSSLIPQASRQDSLNQFHRKGLVDDKLSYTNHLQSPRSLFIESISGQRESLSSRRPSFNVSMVNNEGHPLERGGNVMSSPFYSGNITFGGANAAGTSAMRQNRRILAGTSEFQLRVPRRSSVQVKPSNATGVDSSGMSQTAKRILEALEHFSSPISDAKKIPVKTPGLNSTLARKRGRDEAFDQPPTSRVGLRHLTRELAVPTVPDMLKLKRRQRLQDTTLAARRIITAHSEPPPQTPTSSASQEPSEYHLRCESESQKFFGKLRATGKKKHDFEEPPEVVNLPSISLPITSLPSFDIPLPKPSCSTTTVTATIESKSSSTPSKTFKFSSPIKLQNDSTSPVKSINHFTFSKPLSPSTSDRSLKQGLKTPSSPSTPTTVSNSMNFSFGSSQAAPATNFMWSGSSTAPRPKQIKQTEKKQKKDDVELKSGSVLDVLSTFKKSSDIWECSECFIKNNQSEEHCAACKKPRKKETSEKPSSASTIILPSPGASDTPFGAQFKMSNDKWECQYCLVRNPVSETKCVSCMTPKSEKKAETPTLAAPTPILLIKSDLMDKFKPAKDSWECPGCMLRNPSTIISCPCCNASKPGLLKTPVPKKPEEVKPLIPTNTSKTWECPSCMVRNDLSAATCVCCTTPNPQASSKPPVGSTAPTIPSISAPAPGFGDKFKMPTGSWSCDICMIQNKSDVNECAACGASKPGATASKSKASGDALKNDSAPKFNFGIPSSIAPTFSFGIPSDSKSEEKPKTDAPTNGFTFGVPVTQSSQSFTFGVPKPTQEPAKTASFTFAAPKPVEPFKSEEKKPEIQTLFNNISDTKVGFSFSKPAETKPETPKEHNPTPVVEVEKAEPVKSISFGTPIPTLTTESPQSTPATTAAASTPSLFTFSKQPVSTTQSAPVLTFGQSTAPMGQTITPSISQEAPKTSETSESVSKPVLTFGKSESTPALFGDTTTENKPLLTFGAPVINNSEKPAFPVEKKFPSFGTIEQNPRGFFGNGGEKPMASAPAPAFGVPSVASTTAAATPATPALLFGSSSNSGSMFGNATPNFGAPSSASAPMFASPKPAEPAPPATPGLFTFGAPSGAQTTPQASGGFNFAGNNGAKPVFGFSGSQSTPQPAAGGFGGFGGPTPGITAAPTPAFGFSAPKNEATLSFGQTPSTPASSIFGNSQPSPASSFGTLNSGAISSGSSGGFNFGPSAAPPSATPSIPSSASTSGGFNFSAAASGFSFNAPSQPSFNFTGGNAPPTFNATPQATTPTTRKIKKAVRRMPPRA